MSDHNVEEAIAAFKITEEQSRELYNTDPTYRRIIDSIAHGASAYSLIWDLFSVLKEERAAYQKTANEQPIQIPIIDYLSLIKPDAKPLDEETINRFKELMRNQKPVFISSTDSPMTVTPLFPKEIEIDTLIEYFENVIRMYEEVNPVGGWQWIHDHAIYCLKYLKPIQTPLSSKETLLEDHTNKFIVIRSEVNNNIEWQVFNATEIVEAYNERRGPFCTGCWIM
jgi:hypothetical protein